MSDNFDDPWDEPDAATYWKWSLDDPEIRGEVISVAWQTGGDYGDQLVVTVRRPDGKLFKVACTSMLQKAVEEQRPAAGDQIRIKYFGERSGKGGYSYKFIQMRLRRRDPDAPPPDVPAPSEVPAPSQPASFQDPENGRTVSAALPAADDFDDDIPFRHHMQRLEVWPRERYQKTMFSVRRREAVI